MGISEIKKCARCPELVANRKNVVTLEGQCPAEILFLTNAPRAREDTQKRPLAGTSGKFFYSLIQALKLDSNFRLAFLPVVMCLPPARHPTEEEIFACNDNVHSLIKEVNPKVILAMGIHTHCFVLGVPLRNLRPDENWGKIVYSDFGKSLTRQVPVILTFDPNEVLRKRNQFEGMYIRHLRAATKLVFNIPQK